MSGRLTKDPLLAVIACQTCVTKPQHPYRVYEGQHVCICNLGLTVDLKQSCYSTCSWSWVSCKEEAYHALAGSPPELSQEYVVETFVGTRLNHVHTGTCREIVGSIWLSVLEASSTTLLQLVCIRQGRMPGICTFLSGYTYYLRRDTLQT